MSKRMAYHASHDSLTGLPNRREFENQLELAIMTASLENRHHVICYMDLDQFKIVNDTCGHIAGDELLKQLASVLKTVIRESDILARLGGDEFGLLLTGCSVKVAEKIAEKFRRIVEEFRFHWDSKTFKVGVSIGLVPIYKDSGDMSYILSAADSACYLAKEHGRNRIHTYTINDATLAKHTDEMNWTHRIHDALENDRFVLYGQEIISVFGVTPGYHEVLIRMIGDDGKIIPPMAFLTAAERYNLISDIDLWVIRNTLDFFSQLDESYHKISINLSGQTLGNSRAMSRIIQYIDESKVSPERICFEITETAMISNLNSAKRFVSTLRGFGCKMALDDFGSGLSSFSYLKNLPVNYLKIDGDFVRNMDSDEINAAMVESIIQVGHKMGLEIIAEYVENDAILEKLKTMGANYAQGYGIAKPKPLEDIVKPTTPAIKQAKVKL
jgi:diguanylate cyclase (GGDEF)-like protein